jgi:hypothetical protein
MAGGVLPHPTVTRPGATGATGAAGSAGAAGADGIGFDGWTNVVTDHGAVGDGTTNDDTAFAAAIATGKNVYIPPGTLASPKHYLLTATLNPIEGQTIKMGGYSTAHYGAITPFSTEWASQLSYIPTCILYTGQSNFTFNLNKRHVTLDGIYVLQDRSYLQTSSGGHFKLGDLTYRNYETRILNCRSENAYKGLYAYGYNQTSFVDKFVVIHPTGIGIHVDIPVPWGDLIWSNIFIHPDNRVFSAANAIGLKVSACDTSRIMGITISGYTTNKYLWLAGDTATIGQFKIIGAQIENAQASANNIVFGDGAHLVTDCVLTGLETHSSYDAVLYMGTNSYGCTVQAEALRGYRYVDDGDRNKLINSRIHNYGSAKTGNAIELYGTDSIVSNTHCEDFAASLHIAASGTYANIVGNNFRNTTAALSATTDATAKATGRGASNIGLADW